MKSSYQQYFYPTIWERGRDYFQQGHISDMDIEYQGDSIEIEATVEGTTDYQVFLTFLEGDVVEAGCDCPFAEEGHYCKHMAAVCFAFEEGAKQSRPVPLMPSKQESIESLLEAMSEQTLREFCLQRAEHDTSFEQALRRFLSAEKGQFSLDNALDEVDSIIESYQDHGFIDYEESFGFEDEMTDFLGDCLQSLRRVGDVRLHARFVLEVLSLLDSLEIDDSAGVLTTISSQCLASLEIYIGREDELLFTCLAEALSEEALENLDFYIEEFLEDHFHGQEFLEKQLQLSIQKMEKHREDAPYAFEFGISQCLEFIKKFPKDSPRVKEFCKQYWESSLVREFYLERLVELGEVEQALPLLEKELEQETDIVASCGELLKDLYAELGMEEQYEHLLWKLVTEISFSDMQLYRELRSLYSVKQWMTLREEVLMLRLAKGDKQPYKIYAEEALWGRLLDSIANRIDLLDTYWKTLRNHVPEQLLICYRNYLESEASWSGGRDHYRKLVTYLRKMCHINGGQAVVKEMVEEWRVQYRNRPAMMQELNRV